MLAQHGAWARVPIASITKLMTVLVTLEHAKWNDVVRVRSDAAAVGESTVHLRAGERITVGDLDHGGPDPERQRRGRGARRLRRAR